jgi:hypothetical protein
MQVCAANTAGAHANEDLTGCGTWFWPVDVVDLTRTNLLQHHRSHDAVPTPCYLVTLTCPDRRADSLVLAIELSKAAPQSEISLVINRSSATAGSAPLMHRKEELLVPEGGCE